VRRGALIGAVCIIAKTFFEESKREYDEFLAVRIYQEKIEKTNAKIRFR
jgi:hypothetical protein